MLPRTLLLVLFLESLCALLQPKQTLLRRWRGCGKLCKFDIAAFGSHWRYFLSLWIFETPPPHRKFCTASSVALQNFLGNVLYMKPVCTDASLRRSQAFSPSRFWSCKLQATKHWTVLGNEAIAVLVSEQKQASEDEDHVPYCSL